MSVSSAEKGAFADALLGLVFVAGGWKTLRNPKPRVSIAEPVLDAVEATLPADASPNRTSLVQANALPS
jgi:hypothetical protein